MNPSFCVLLALLRFPFLFETCHLHGDTAIHFHDCDVSVSIPRRFRQSVSRVVCFSCEGSAVVSRCRGLATVFGVSRLLPLLPLLPLLGSAVFCTCSKRDKTVKLWTHEHAVKSSQVPHTCRDTLDSTVCFFCFLHQTCS